MATESGAVLSKAPEKSIKILHDYGYYLGHAFQIIDDILDFIGTEEEMGKPVGSDLAQGTVTLPTLMLMEKYPLDNPVKRIFEGGKKKKINGRQLKWSVIRPSFRIVSMSLPIIASKPVKSEKAAGKRSSRDVNKPGGLYCTEEDNLSHLSPFWI